MKGVLIIEQTLNNEVVVTYEPPMGIPFIVMRGDGFIGEVKRVDPMRISIDIEITDEMIKRMHGGQHRDP